LKGANEPQERPPSLIDVFAETAHFRLREEPGVSCEEDIFHLG
jgi:hypothetical protein